ncbi:MAG: host attachment protein [Gammaproteobacteria bacterium]|nr:host attachment protein [Gammaproteobacteria bacterium]
MSHTWVLVADSSRARIFEAESSKGPLKELTDLIFPESRLHAQQLTSDLPGRTFDSNGPGRHDLEERTDVKESEAINFARSINAHLEKSRLNGAFRKLVVAATPSFLGILRKTLNSNTSKMVTQEIDKNLVKFDIKDVRKHLPERI